MKWLVAIALCSLTSCQETQVEVTKPDEEAPAEPSPAAVDPLSQTLAGKMARMEELLNAIERFLGDPNMHSRLLADAEEFHQLLAESRALYPEELDTEDQQGFSTAVDDTLQASSQLKEALVKRDSPLARTALEQLYRHRKDAHARYSY